MSESLGEVHYDKRILVTGGAGVSKKFLFLIPVV
jgi:hypothetical protein